MWMYLSLGSPGWGKHRNLHPTLGETLMAPCDGSPALLCAMRPMHKNTFKE